MSITDAGALEKQCQERYGESAKIVVPWLLESSFTPFRVAIALGVYPNTIRYWLSTHGYQ